MAFLTLRMALICEPRWKWSSSNELSRSFCFKNSTASIISFDVRPNFERSPPEASQRPEPRVDSLARMPMRGRTPMRLEMSAMSLSSDAFSTTRMTVRPSLAARSAVSTYSSSL